MSLKQLNSKCIFYKKLCVNILSFWDFFLCVYGHVSKPSSHLNIMELNFKYREPTLLGSF